MENGRRQTTNTARRRRGSNTNVGETTTADSPANKNCRHVILIVHRHMDKESTCNNNDDNNNVIHDVTEN